MYTENDSEFAIRWEMIYMERKTTDNEHSLFMLSILFMERKRNMNPICMSSIRHMTVGAPRVLICVCAFVVSVLLSNPVTISSSFIGAPRVDFAFNKPPAVWFSIWRCFCLKVKHHVHSACTLWKWKELQVHIIYSVEQKWNRNSFGFLLFSKCKYREQHRGYTKRKRQIRHSRWCHNSQSC